MEHLTFPFPLETARLVLRPPSPADAESIQEAIEESFEDLHLWMPWAVQMQSLEGTKSFLEGAQIRFRSNEDFAFSGFLKDTGRFALSTGLHPRNRRVPSFEIGYWCRHSMQRQGLTTEAVRALTRTAFVAMAAHRVEIRCDSRNLRSRRVADLAGYRLEAQLHSDDRANDGSLRDTLVYVKLREDFERQE